MTEPDSIPALFSGPEALRAAFDQGLAGMLEHDLLGVFILVLANASFDQASFDRLKVPLRASFERWDDRFTRGGALALDAPPDDVDVFRRLQAHGFDHLQVTRWRRVGPWELQFNQLRAFRPPRMSGSRVACLRKAFDPDGFHFNKPFLRKEVLWEGELLGRQLRLLFNKFPFAESHGLLVLDPDAGKPQFLTAVDHRTIWEICTSLGDTLPGLGFGYNAHGAYASVNHLHFQMFMRRQGRYPIEHERWSHNGGDIAYPLPVRCLNHVDEAWGLIDGLQRTDRAFNLMYRPGRVYLVERALQGSYVHSDWTGGFAWSELVGAVTLFDAKAFKEIGAARIDAEMARMHTGPQA